MLNLDFTEEQDMLRDMVRGICERHAPLDEVRRLEDDALGIAVDLWDQMSDLGICGLLIPEEFGGAGMGTMEGVVVQEELGRALAPVPHLVSSTLCAGAIMAGGSDRQRRTLLSEIASGDMILTPAWIEPGNGWSADGVQMRAVADGDDFVLDGTKMHVEFASAARLLIVLARVGDAPDAIDLFLVPSDAAGVVLTQKLSISSNTQYRIDFDDVWVSADSRIGPAGSGWSTWNTALERAAVLAAARAVGGAMPALDMTVEYAKNREQFDKPLGAFQSISHYLADARTSLDGARVLVHEAAWASDEGRDVGALAPMAKLKACDTYRDITAMAQQVFGGIGFTVDHDIQLYFRRAKQLQLSWWDQRECERRIASAVLD